MLNCLDTAVLSHPFWTLATLPLCFYVRSCWTYRNWQGHRLVQSNLGGKNTIFKRKLYSLRNDNLVSRGLQRASTKIGKIFALHHRELMKKRPILCTFCRQSAIRGLTRRLSYQPFWNQKSNTCCLCSTAHCVCVCVCARARASVVVEVRVQKATSAVF